MAKRALLIEWKLRERERGDLHLDGETMAIERGLDLGKLTEIRENLERPIFVVRTLVHVDTKAHLQIVA